jgi:predicted site-specific integrase-resolvase
MKIALFTDAPGRALIQCARAADNSGGVIVTAVGVSPEGKPEATWQALQGLLGRATSMEFDIVFAALNINGNQPGLFRIEPVRLPGNAAAQARNTASTRSEGRPPRVAIYHRTACRTQLAKPVADQVLACMSYMTELRGVLVEVYVDDGVSGLHTRNRSGLDALKNAVLDNDIDVVIVEDLARIAREPIPLRTFSNWLNARGVELHTLDQGLVQSSGIPLGGEQ